MTFTSDETKLLRTLVQNEIDSFNEEGKTIFTDDNPAFLALEEKYEEFLERLLKKL